MNYIYEEHLSRVASAMIANSDTRGETLTAIIRRGIIERWPEQWLVAALEQHASVEQAEELAHQERTYYEQSLLIAEQKSVAERLGLNAYKEWRVQPSACSECKKLSGVLIQIDSNFPTYTVNFHGIWINSFFSYCHSYCECQMVFSFKK